MKIKFKRILMAATAVAIMSTSLTSCGLSTVSPGYVGVVYSARGGTKQEVLQQGMHWTSFYEVVCQYTVALEQSYLTSDSKGDSGDDESFSACSSEGKDLQIDLTFTYQFDSEHIPDIFTIFKAQDGVTVRDTFIKPNIVSWTKEVVAKYSVTDILGAERANINKALTEYLSEKFEPYYIKISNVSLINIDVDDQTAQAINKKISAQQNAETQAIENQTAIDKAKAEAEATITRANADAEKVLIEAQAQAEANRLLQESIDETILEQNWIDKWDGKLPTYMSGDSGSIMLSFGDNTNE